MVSTYRFTIIVIVVVIALLAHVKALRLSFTPSDEESIPLSTKYRNSLRKLCQLMKESGKLPDNLRDQEDKIRRQCAQLAKDDRNVAGGLVDSLGRGVVISLIGASGLVVYYALHNDLGVVSQVAKSIVGHLKRLVAQISVIIGKFTQSYTRGNNSRQQEEYPNSHPKDNHFDAQKARDARLKRFAEESAKKLE